MKQRIANEALRINQAINCVSTSVIITDNHYKIIYLNSAAQQLFTTTESKIRQDLPPFFCPTVVRLFDRYVSQKL